MYVRQMAILIAVAGAIAAAGCGKKAPPEANAALDAALKALAAGDTAAFVALVVPDQRDAVTDLDEWSSFFRDVKSHEIDNEFDSHVTATTATIRTSLYFDDEQKAFSHIAFPMKKVGDKWLIDMNETIKIERDTNGAHAFQIWTFEEQ